MTNSPPEPDDEATKLLSELLLQSLSKNPELAAKQLRLLKKRGFVTSSELPADPKNPPPEPGGRKEETP